MERYRTDNLPEELVHEILLRLPVKALLVCKCVCKVWCALIESPSFVNRHFNHESNQECLVFYGFDEKDQDGYTMYDDNRHSLVEAPNHLPQMPTFFITEGPEKGIFFLSLSFCFGLYNPATREFKTLPPIPPLHKQGYRDPPWIGFGLDPSSGDLKVVVFKQNEHCNYAYIYNLSSDSWKTIETIIPYDKLRYSAGSIPILNGVKHWLAKFANRDACSILAFDMRSDKFQEIAIPDALGKVKRGLQIIAYCDSVAMMSFKCNECIDMWVMGRDGLWSKSISIDPFQENVWPLLVWKKNKVFFESSNSHLIMCDISTQKVSKPQFGMDPEFCSEGGFIYKESLVSIKGKRADCLDDVFRLWVTSVHNEMKVEVEDGSIL